VRPALVVVKFTSAMIEAASGGNSKLGFRVVINNLQNIKVGKLECTPVKIKLLKLVIIKG
jgi:hypothetical protein